MIQRRTQKVLLAIACCFVLVLLPLSTASAQGGLIGGAKQGIEKGAEGVKKGTETVIDKTKEGAEAVGKGAKDLVTDDDKDTDRMKPSQSQRGTTAPATTPSQSTSSPSTSTNKSTTTPENKTDEGKLPRTAGELPLLALAGAIALASAGALKVVRRIPKAN